MSQGKKNKMKSPNKEQQEAIGHNGGVLLNAGAGSGKNICTGRTYCLFS